jgi:hypothetical protein
MVCIGKMRMHMFHRLVVMPMAVLEACSQNEAWQVRVLMLVVRVVLMYVFMIHRFMKVGMLVALGQV